MTALWIGEPLLKLLGISTAALTATGGIALAYAAIPLMRGKAGAVEEPSEPDDEAPGPRPISSPSCSPR
ncbi:MarC family protein [Nonomuraea sp. NPDC059023]|uniref:MarC family protein n=1 Tax=unclassified Nonomuraea TaxID=2593643 RepID=UPI0036794739